MKEIKNLIFNLLLAGIILFTSAESEAQLFSENNINVNLNATGKVNWVDFDNDGYLDIFYFFTNANGTQLKLFKNDQNGHFALKSSPFASFKNASFYLTDFNNDKTTDIILNGEYSGQNKVIYYANQGNWNFISKVLNVTGTQRGAIVAEDLNNDGRKDIIVAGLNNDGNPMSRIYLRTINDQLSYIPSPIMPLFDPIIAVYDLDNNGTPEIFISGQSENTDNANNSINNSALYRIKNNVVSKINTSLPAFSKGSVDFGDFNNDGFADIIITGILDLGDADSSLSTIVLSNDGLFNFNEVQTNIPGFADGIVQWGDYNNDGFPDFFISGISPALPSGNMSNIYTNEILNNGNLPFEPLVNIAYQMLNESYGVWGDYDNDGDLDVIYIGNTAAHQTVIKVITNHTTVVVNLPIEPTGLTTTIESNHDPDGFLLGWSLPVNADIFSDGYTYNVRMGTTPGGSEIISPNVNYEGKIVIPKYGNAGNSKKYLIRGLSLGKYYWSVQTVSQSFVGSEFAPEKILIVNKSTSVQQTSTQIPEATDLSQNYPNPFNPETKIDFTLHERSGVSLAIYNSAGQLVESLVNEVLSPGTYTINWNTFGSALSSGVYFYRLVTDNKIVSKRMILLK
ncbi:T9SS type A sorting domain-containing protein [Ignavibacteria bacterium CHB1]|nr:hypothetical protein [Ignavibacteria bacterium]MDL1887935.1 T9SS type A sorting domain-containing protein [Ignavibacteria bacterium CHB1]